MTESIAGAEVPAPWLSIVIPAYNEERRITSSMETMLDYFDGRDYTYEIAVVDDGSSDATVETVRRVTGDRANVRIEGYEANRGKGYAVRFGMLRAAGDFVLFSDADLATPIDEVEKLLSAIRGGADVAIASRDLPESRLEKRQNWFREMGGKLFNRFVQMLAVPGIHDTQCGFKLFTRVAAQNIFSRCQIDNFSFDVEALYLARQLGYTIAEIPVRWKHVEGSKVSVLRDAPRMVRTLFRIRATDYRLKQTDPKRSSTL